MDIDVKVAEHLKNKMDELSLSIDRKIEGVAQKAQETGNAEAGKLTTALKEELTGEIAKFNELNKQFTDRLDLIETKAGKFDQVMARKSMADAFMQKLADSGVKKSFRGDVNFTPDDFRGVTLKQNDMTSGNSFTNNVPGYDHLPEIHFDSERKERARDLILQGVTGMAAIEYIRETAETDNTGMTTEGSEFNQNDFSLTAYTANVRKITAYVMLSEEMLDDVEGMTSYILAKLPQKINKVEDEQILRGLGTGVLLSGLVTNATAYSDALADTNVQRIDVLVDAVRQVEASNYVPSNIVLNPVDYYALALTKNSNGDYLLPWILGVINPQLAGVPIVKTTAISSGDFLVLSREAAQVFYKKELTIEFSNSNEDNFIKGMVTVRAQKRLALPIYKPSAMVTGDFTVALAEGTA